LKLHALLLKIAGKTPIQCPEDLEAHLEKFLPTQMKSETLQKAFGISGFELEEVYAEAHMHYAQDAFLEAATAFRWLVFFNTFVPKYWMGLAASLQMLEKYDKALHAYALSALLDSHNPYPHFHAYECYVELNNKEDADKALELAYRRTQGKAAYTQLRNEIQSLKES